MTDTFPTSSIVSRTRTPPTLRPQHRGPNTEVTVSLFTQIARSVQADGLPEERGEETMDQKTADGARVKDNFRLGDDDDLLGYCKRHGISTPDEFADEKESGSCRSGQLKVRGTRLRRLQVCEGQW